MKNEKYEVENINRKWERENLNISIKYVNGLIIKEFRIKNYDYLKILDILNKKNFSFVPKFIKIDPNFVIYKYIDGKIHDSNDLIKKSNVKILAKIIYDLTLVLLNTFDNEMYAHGYISLSKLILNKRNKIVAVLDWEVLHHTKNIHEDLFYTMWTCFKINEQFKTRKKLKFIKLFLKKYGYEIYTENDRIVHNFLLIFNQTFLREQKNNNNSEIIRSWINDSINFVKTNEDKLNRIEKKFYTKNFKKSFKSSY